MTQCISLILQNGILIYRMEFQTSDVFNTLIFSYCSPAHNSDKRDTIAVISDYLKHKNLYLCSVSYSYSHVKVSSLLIRFNLNIHSIGLSTNSKVKMKILFY